MRVIVVGCGSIGKRHIQNFLDLGVSQVGAVDTREDRRQEVAERFGLTQLYASVDEGLAEGYDAAVVGVPTRFHLEVAEKAVATGTHLLVEKPIADRLEGVPAVLEKAASSGLVFMVGYTYRFWPPLMRVKELLDQGAIGRVYAAQITFSEYLPDWHPWEDYRSWFMASKDMGGGALLDESHALDIARWLFGDVETIFGLNGTVSELEITSDDLVEVVATFRSGVVASVHMDLFGREHRRSLSVMGQRGNLDWDFFTNEVRVHDAEAKITQTFRFSTDRNEMFIDEARNFLASIEGKAVPPVDGWDGLETLRMALAVAESSSAGRAVRLGPGDGER